jgi:uncharacterized protein
LLADPTDAKASVRGSVIGREIKSYRFSAIAGQHIDVSLVASNPNLYFNLEPPSGPAIFHGDTMGTGQRFTGALEQTGSYLVTLHFVRGMAGRGASSTFTLDVVRRGANGDVAGPAPTLTPVRRGQSFDCATAQSPTELAICERPGLASLDREYAAVRQRAIAAARRLDSDRDVAERDIRTSDSLFVARRNACGTVDACIAASYARQISRLEAGWLRRGDPPVVFICDSVPSSRLVAIFVDTDPPAVRLEHGDERVVAVSVPTDFGTRYVADNGYSFWRRGPEAIVEWPLGKHLKCYAR